MQVLENDSPRLIDTGRGLSVYYKERYLYSRYAPSATMERTLQALSIQPETLVICYSPVLCYGIDTLLESLPESCAVIAIEFDSVLFEFSRTYLPTNCNTNRFTYLNPKTPSDICTFLREQGDTFCAQFRRCITIDCSGGVDLQRDTLHTATDYVRNFIATFWKNRMTLIALGKLYAVNFIRNMAQLPTSGSIPLHTVSRPTVVLGAGPSLEQSISFVKSQRSSLCVIAVESAVPALAAAKLYPDIIVAVESQSANTKAFIGSATWCAQAALANGCAITLYADITSRPSINRSFAKYGNVCFFTSRYTDADFFTDAIHNNIAPLPIPPLGSVGLAAIQLALHVTEKDAPIFVSGLDFSFPAEKTHANSSAQYIVQSTTMNRFSPLGTPTAAFAVGARQTAGKNGVPVYTTPALEQYATLTEPSFGQNRTLYDIGLSGLNLNLCHLSEQEATVLIKQYPVSANYQTIVQPQNRNQQYNAIRTWLDTEIQNLTFIANSLEHGTSSFDCLKSAITKSGYLYLHFPDGCREITNDSSLMKRIKAESISFLKQLKLSRTSLSEED